MRHSLLVRLSALTLAVTVVSVAATAWLAALILNRGIQQANGKSQAEIVSVYATLLQYGATHRDWAGVGPVVNALSRRTKQQIALTDLSDQRLAFAQTTPQALPLGSPVAVVDPLHVDPSLDPVAPASRIDPAAVGPLALSAYDRAELDYLAETVLNCVKGRGGGRVVIGPSGRPEVLSTVPAAAEACGAADLATYVLPDQKAAIIELTLDIAGCLKARRLDTITIEGNLSWEPSAHETSAQLTATQNCLDNARREQLASWVAPPAVLDLATSSGQQRALVLSPGNEVRIAEVAAAVIAIAIGATLLAGFRLVRPLRALTTAARGVEVNGFTEVPEISGNDEIAHLTRAFNRMARTQVQMEDQRKIAISDIAHELRTPLANIRAWLEAARDGLADNDSTLARSLLEEAMLLQRTVDDLQLLALADAGQLKLHLQEVPLAPLLQQARAALSGPAEATGVTINLACPDTVVVVDPDRLRQIVQNLVSNAIRHSHPAGSVDIRATAKNECFRVDVINHGPGIAATDLPRVYDRFWRAEKSRSRAAGGSGLGLAIVRQLAEAHGGTVAARSIPGEETVFSVLVPIPAHPPGQDPVG
jgi:two-component system, OmpR family, sensor histidine kinase BaeS